MKKYIPNFLTSCNLFCGCVAVSFIFQLGIAGFLPAFVLMAMAALFDFFDGFAARKLNVVSLIGKDLDSLADLISFGLVPASALYKALQHNFAGYPDYIVLVVPCLAFLIAVFSALRLAKFNNDPNQKSSFVGLATPANALLIMSYLLAAYRPYFSLLITDAPGMDSSILIFCIIAISCYLLVSNINMYSLKTGDKTGFFLIGLGVILCPFIGFFGPLFSCIAYVCQNLWIHNHSKRD